MTQTKKLLGMYSNPEAECVDLSSSISVYQIDNEYAIEDSDDRYDTADEAWEAAKTEWKRQDAKYRKSLQDEQ